MLAPLSCRAFRLPAFSKKGQDTVSVLGAPALPVQTLRTRTGKENTLTYGELQRLTLFIMGSRAKCVLPLRISQGLPRPLPRRSGHSPALSSVGVPVRGRHL